MSGRGGGSKMIGLSRRIYERLLAAYPERFRELYGEEMADLFEEECREQTKSGGRKRLFGVWFGAISDLTVNAALERGKFLMTLPVTRWGGFLSAVGGLLLIITTLLMSGLPPYVDLTWSYPVHVAQTLGVLLLAAGPVALVALIAGAGHPDSSRLSRPGRLGPTLNWTQKSAVAGFLLSGFTIVAVLGLVVTDLLFYFTFLDATLLNAFSLLSFLGLSAATMLLGFFVWRSGFLDRWRTLPLVVGLLTFLTPLASDRILQLASDHLVSSHFSLFLSYSIPQTALGLAWMLMGFVLVRRGNTGRDLRLGAGTT